MNNLAVFNYNGQTITRRPNGYINLTQMCQANGKRLDNWMRLKQTQECINALENHLQTQVIDSEEGVKGGTWGHPKLAENLMAWLSASKIRKNGNQFEISHHKRLWQEVGGEIEVPTKTGRIDILTDTYVVEIKDVRHWKAAVGQVLVYQLEFPSHQARIHLYGKSSNDHKAMIISYCAKLGVLATFAE